MERGIVSERRTLWYFEEGPVPRLTSLEAAEEFSVQMQLKICSFCESNSQRAVLCRDGTKQATRDSSTHLHSKMGHEYAEHCVSSNQTGKHASVFAPSKLRAERCQGQ